MIIGLTGAAGAGKSTAAAYLEERFGFARVRFAGPLKAMVRAFLAETGATPAEIERLIEGDRKEAAAPELGGASPRRFMQALGTEFGRDLIHPQLWVEAWVAGARAKLAQGAPGVVVEDCRFPNEAAAIVALGGTLVRIVRPLGGVVMPAHISEGQALPMDHEIKNSGSVVLLCDRLARIVAAERTLAA